MSDRFETAFSNAQNNDTLVLVDKRRITVKSEKVMALITAFILLTMSVVIFFIFLQESKKPDVGWIDTMVIFFAHVDWSKVNSIRFDPIFLLQTGGLIAFFVFFDRAKKFERLILSHEGIRYDSPFPKFLKRFKQDWSLNWNQVSTIEFGFPAIVHPQRRNTPEFCILTFIAGEEKQFISPMRWVNPKSYAAPKKLRNAFRFRLSHGDEVDIKQAVSESEVVRYLSAKQPHIAVNWDLNVVETMTSLEKNLHGKISIAVLMLLLAYTVIDLMLGSDSYIDEPTTLTHIYVVSGIVGAVLSGLWLSRSSLQLFEKWGLAILFGVVTSAAMLPGALRINALAGNEGLITYDCRVIQGTDGIILQPLIQGVPSIEYFAKNSYWNKFGKDDVYPVQIRKGILGFYQFDSAAIIERIENDK
jgi:hypothetical protein